jgi:hypothetical protein
MGTYSFFRNSKHASTCKIDWNSINTETLFKFSALKYAYEKRCETLEDVGKYLNETKLFGYMTWDVIEAIVELNRHLLPKNGTDLPTLYFEWEGGDIAQALEFYTGTELVNILSYDYSHLTRDVQRLPFDEVIDLYKKIFEEIVDLDIVEWETQPL